jgi:hypothetical protein
MSVEAAFDNVSIALKNFWQACFMDENGRSLDWTKPLITTINTPRLKLIVTPTDGGAMKAYTGYELPENISITMYETPDKKVEKYLDGWMFGPNGVFNKGTGKFRSRSQNQVTNIYRCVQFSTFFWENEDPSAGQPANVKQKSPGIKEALANVKTKQPKTLEVPYYVTKWERSGFYMKQLVAQQQVASQLTSLVSGVANQALGHIPAMAVGRVIIPPPLVRKPLLPPVTAGKFPAAEVERSIKKISTLQAAEERPENSIQKRETLESGEERVEESIKKYAHREKILSTTVYTCAIEGYDVAAYDYETGGPVSYSVNLSVLNYRPEYS